MGRRRAALLGLIAVAFLWLCQFLTVTRNYNGNWTALFRISDKMTVPDFLRSERLYTFSGPGYDGQVYHLIAHDPWMQKGSAAAVGQTAFRYQRILVPALAWCLALGDDSNIHAAYFGVILLFAFLGVYWLSRLEPMWGLAFVFAPAVIVSIDRMTADIALAALTVGFALHVKDSPWKTAAILACAALTRETALPIIAGFTIYQFTKRRFFDAALGVASAIPAGAWYLYLARHAGPSSAPTYLGWIPFAGIVNQLIHPNAYTLSPFKAAIATAFDYVAIFAVLIALVFTAQRAIERRWTAVTAAVYALALAAIFLQSRSVWEDANAFGRVLTPLLLLVAIDNPRWPTFAPLVMVDARLSLDLWSQFAGLFRW